MYAIVRAGGRQEKVAVGDVLEIDRLQAEPGSSVDLPVLLLVDGDDVTSDKSALAKASVTVEVVAATKGPKIHILKYKNKTGYRVRKGHRQKHTQVLVTGIEADRANPKAAAPKPAVTKATETTTAKKSPATKSPSKTTTAKKATPTAKTTTAAKTATAAKTTTAKKAATTKKSTATKATDTK